MQGRRTLKTQRPTLDAYVRASNTQEQQTKKGYETWIRTGI